MKSPNEDLQKRVERAMRLDADMQKALRDRMRSIPEQEAEEAVAKIEKTVRRSLELRKEAERRKQQGAFQNPQDLKLISQELLDSTHDMVNRVLRATMARLELQGVTPEIAAPLVHASVDSWVDSASFLGLYGEVPVPSRYVPEQQIEPVAVLDGLTRIEAYCRSVGSFDAVVGVNSGGSIVTRYLGFRLGITSAFKVRTEGLNVVFGRPIPKNMRILVVDDIARSGRTASLVWSALGAAGIVQAKYVTLVSSMTCRAALRKVPVYSPVIAARNDTQLPWNTQGELTIVDDNYVFGPASDPDAFSIPQRQAQFIVRRLIDRK